MYPFRGGTTVVARLVAPTKIPKDTYVAWWREVIQYVTIVETTEFPQIVI